MNAETKIQLWLEEASLEAEAKGSAQVNLDLLWGEVPTDRWLDLSLNAMETALDYVARTNCDLGAMVVIPLSSRRVRTLRQPNLMRELRRLSRRLASPPALYLSLPGHWSDFGSFEVYRTPMRQFGSHPDLRLYYGYTRATAGIDAGVFARYIYIIGDPDC